MKEIIKESPVNPPESERPPELPPRHDDAEAARRIEKLAIDSVAEKVHSFGDKKYSRKLFRSLARLVIELEDEIQNYDTLLSDDASGRRVTLFFKELINKKREALGKSRVQTYFLANRGVRNRQAIEEFIRQKKSSIHKALLVTEHISTGQSINGLAEAIGKEHVDFDVAAVSISQRLGEYYHKIGDWIKRLRYGTRGDMAGLILYNQPSMAGVTKNKGYEDKGAGSAHPTKYEKPDRELMKRARHDMKLMAEEISKLIL